jgi:hypothetical protein
MPAKSEVTLLVIERRSVLSASAVHADECSKPPDLHDGWEVAAPEAQGLDPAVLCAIGPRFEAWHEANAHAVLVVRHGVLVYEHYFTGEDESWGGPLGRVAYDAGKLHPLRRPPSPACA